jgi:hypothetical protein
MQVRKHVKNALGVAGQQPQNDDDWNWHAN